MKSQNWRFVDHEIQASNGEFFLGMGGLHGSQPSECLRLQKTDEDFMQVHRLTLGDFTHPPQHLRDLKIHSMIMIMSSYVIISSRFFGMVLGVLMLDILSWKMSEGSDL